MTALPMTTHELTRTAADGVALYARCWLPAGTPHAVVQLVHGLGEDGGRYIHLAGALTATGFALLAPDLRGHGRSGGPRGHAPMYALLLDSIALWTEEATRIVPDRPCFLYGHSLGGGLALNYVLRRRPRLAGVIAGSPALRIVHAAPAWKRRLGELLVPLLPALALPTGIKLSELSHDQELVQAQLADSLGRNRISIRLGLDLVHSGAWALAHAADFSLPLLIMHGSADTVTSSTASRLFCARAPGDVTFQCWDGLYHELHNETARAEVFAFVLAWLEAHLGG